jgi:predicted ATP-binding protein involved in virulence
MRIAQLSLDNVRAFKEAEFTFNPGFNLIIGINGAGKSTALDAIRYCGSHLLPVIRKMPFKPFGFGVDDIHNDAPFAEAALHIGFGDKADAFVRLREWREQVATESSENLARLRREILETARPRDRLRNQLRELVETDSPADNVYFYPSERDLKKRSGSESSAPLMIHYSTARSYYRDRKERTSASAPDQAAYYEALASSTLNLRLVAEWLRAQHALSVERPESSTLVDTIATAVSVFLPEYSSLRTAEDDTSRVLIDHDGLPLNVRQLSDGERSVLALVLDLAKRLAQANPALKDPLADAEAVVLIDEIDLHLHPQWQRKIVGNLERTFPKCQFIATTHSPQVIGEVPHEKIQMIKGGEIHSPMRSFGIDSSRVLEEIMDTDARNVAIEEEIAKIAKLIGDRKRAEAREAIEKLAAEIGADDPEIVRARTLLDFMEGDA